MDVSFTNVLEGARQYFQGIPVPSSGGTNSSSSSDNNDLIPSSTGSYDSTTQNHGTRTSTPVQVSQTTNNKDRDATRYSMPSISSSASSSSDVGPSSTDNAASSSNTFWSPSIEPYAPQPTRVEVPDTRPGEDENSALETSPSSTEIITLTEMQPSSSPAPVYQQLNNVNRTSSTVNKSISPTMAVVPPPTNEKQPIVPQRTQYYPRYHHPDITKSTPLPVSQNSLYQSTPISSSERTESRPIEQNNNNHHPSAPTTGAHQRVQENSYPGPGSIYGMNQINPNAYQHERQLATSGPPSHQLPKGSMHCPVSSVTSSPSCPSMSSRNHNIPSSPSHPAHIPSPHLPSGALHHSQSPSHYPPPPPPPPPHHVHPSLQSSTLASQANRINPPGQHSVNPYGGRVLLPSSVPKQMPPPSGGYHTIPSPHEPPRHATPSPHRQSSPLVTNIHHNQTSPHSNFQPHSPTYPPPAPARSNPHSYNVPTTQHYQMTGASGYTNPPYGHTATSSASPATSSSSSSSSSYRLPQNEYYQSSRSQSYAQSMMGPTQSMISSSSSNGAIYRSQQQQQQQQQQASNKTIAYNGVPDNTMTYNNAYRPASIPRSNSSTHNLPPIAALSSYHSTRRESVAKSQSIRQQQQLSQRVHSVAGSNNNKVPTSTSSLVTNSQRIPEYSNMNHSIPVNGRTTAISSSYSGSRYTEINSQSYPPYATTIAPSHHGHNTSTTSTTPRSGTGLPNIPSNPYNQPGTAEVVSNRVGSSSLYHPPHHSHPRENYDYKDYPYQNSTPASSSSSQAMPIVPTMSMDHHHQQTNGLSSSTVRKRESPLDLSVKTVKTTADSTAQDDLEASSSDKRGVSSPSSIQRSNNGTRSIVPLSARSTPPLPPPPSSYACRSNSNNRNPAYMRAPTPQTVCAPKFDFLPDFNSTPSMRNQQDNSMRRSGGSQQMYMPPVPNQHTSNGAVSSPLPHMSSFRKTSLPIPPQLYDATGGHRPGPSSLPPPPLPPVPASSSSSVRYPIHSKPMPGIPPSPKVIDHPTRPDYHHQPPDTSKYYMDERKYNNTLSPSRTAIKRFGDAVYGAGGPSKQPKLDAWRMAIDEQIQQRISTARALHEKNKRHEMNLPDSLPNGRIVTPGTTGYETRSDDTNYSTNESNRYQKPYCDKRSYPADINNPGTGKVNLTQPMVPQTSIPSGPSAFYSNNRQRTNNFPPGNVTNLQSLNDQPSNTGVDKRVLSLLRNSLENKQQREEQVGSQQPILVNHSQQSFQNKVIAPVEPKTNIGRHNLSPFAAASLLERNSNTPPHYKFHVPRAVDSITQEPPGRNMYTSRVSSSLSGKETYVGHKSTENEIHRDKDDGLAAILAAKIRTKAELKEVGTGQFLAKPALDIGHQKGEHEDAAPPPTSTPSQSGSSSGSPPKLTREKMSSLPPRRRLFSRPEDENITSAEKALTVPPRTSGFRSSSETSVFDFRESDSEGEMPVLERQTLEEMRRDRKQLSKVQPAVPLNNAVCMTSSNDLVKIELKENDKINELDPFWTATCDKFMEQLRAGDVLKKRGRKKKIDDPVQSAKPTDQDEESPKETENVKVAPIKAEDIKKEIPDLESPVIENRGDETPPDITKDAGNSSLPKEEIKITDLKVEDELKEEPLYKQSDDDSDEMPLIHRTARESPKKGGIICKDEAREDEEKEDDEEDIIPRKRRVRRGSRIKLESSSGSESLSEESDTELNTDAPSVAKRLQTRKRSSNNNNNTNKNNNTSENEGMKLRSRDNTPHKVNKNDKETSKCSPSKNSSQKNTKPKPLFGDGSDFRPGWEEEVYVFKKSLRMPARLITVSKPKRFHRLSTSLPDLDPGSPALSVSMDSTDVCLTRKRQIDSDLESNCSFVMTTSKIDDEEATSSTTVSCPPKTSSGNKNFKSENHSIVDLLVQKVGTAKKDPKKRATKETKSEKECKTLKSTTEPELLPTPSLAPLLTPLETSIKGKSPIKTNKSKPIKFNESFLLGYFRKETVNNFRDTFKNNHAMPNEFSTYVLKSRTRTETRVLKKQATIREVFGEDRPASAPPMQNHTDDTSQDDDSQTETLDNNPNDRTRTLKQRVVSRLRNAGILRSHKAIANSKRHLLIAKRRKDLIKSLAEKTLRRIKTEIKSEELNEVDINPVKEEEINVDIIDENEELPSRKKLKLRTGRRKFRSGFDYIRKKKKPLKKDEIIPKERKRQPIVTRQNLESIADIQSEIRTWVIKKGVGDTVLHRAARLGYTDVAAYCLEKLNNAPSPKDNAGYTPLHEACSRGHLEIAKLLLTYGANANESANGGIRPLHEAAENGFTEIVRLLLSYGADPLLATYAGQTPLMLSTDTEVYPILEQHLADIQARITSPWSFGGPATIFDYEETGYDPLDEPPTASPEPEMGEIEMEVSDMNLPVLFSLINDPDKWLLLPDLMAALKIKSRDALLRQINPKPLSGPPTIAHREVMKELKLPDFLEQSRCCHILSGGERINMRASKVTLIKYNEKVKAMLNVERMVINLR